MAKRNEQTFDDEISKAREALVVMISVDRVCAEAVVTSILNLVTTVSEASIPCTRSNQNKRLANWWTPEVAVHS